jgi:CubicO group peptidase (beta-lactamase class C family)
MKIEAQILNNISQNNIIGGAFCLFESDKIIAKGAHGIGQIGKNLQINSLARVASISKLVTAICLLKLVQEGKIDLDQDCSPYLGFKLAHPNFPQSPISARMILSHTSGIRDGENYKGVIGEKLSDFLITGGAQFNNGEHWAKSQTPLGGFCYSNLGMGVIAQIIENVSKQRFDLFAKTQIFDPIGAKCGFNWSGILPSDLLNYSPLYRRANNGNEWNIQVDGDILNRQLPTIFAKPNMSLKDYEIGTNGLLFSPQGGLRASVLDLVKIANVLMGANEILNPQSIENMRQIVWDSNISKVQDGGENGAFMAFGTGIHIIKADNNAPIKGLKSKLFGHYGEAYGLLGGLWFEPNSKKGFAYFVNGSLEQPKTGQSGLFAIEEEIMQAACEDLQLVKNTP